MAWNSVTMGMSSLIKTVGMLNASRLLSMRQLQHLSPTSISKEMWIRKSIVPEAKVQRFSHTILGKVIRGRHHFDWIVQMKWDCQLMSPKEKRKIGAESHYRIEEGMTEKVKRQYLTKSKETLLGEKAQQRLRNYTTSLLKELDKALVHYQKNNKVAYERMSEQKDALIDRVLTKKQYSGIFQRSSPQFIGTAKGTIKCQGRNGNGCDAHELEVYLSAYHYESLSQYELDHWVPQKDIFAAFAAALLSYHEEIVYENVELLLYSKRNIKVAHAGYCHPTTGRGFNKTDLVMFITGR